MLLPHASPRIQIAASVILAGLIGEIVFELYA
jgi:hypothetical protein